MGQATRAGRACQSERDEKDDELGPKDFSPAPLTGEDGALIARPDLEAVGTEDRAGKSADATTATVSHLPHRDIEICAGDEEDTGGHWRVKIAEVRLNPCAVHQERGGQLGCRAGAQAALFDP